MGAAWRRQSGVQMVHTVHPVHIVHCYAPPYRFALRATIRIKRSIVAYRVNGIGTACPVPYPPHPMKNHPLAITLLAAACLSAASLAAETKSTPLPTPDVGQVIQHLLGAIGSDSLYDIHAAKDDHDRQFFARKWYATLFIVWFGTQDHPGSKVFDLDIRDNIRAFLKNAQTEHFASLVDYDDPLGWSRVPPGVSTEEITSHIGGAPYNLWVIEQTKEPAVYKDVVKRFRALVATVKPNE